MLAELVKVIPDFLTRLQRPERGGVWVEYRRERNRALQEAVEELDLAAGDTLARPTPGTRLLRWDESAEDEIIANALYPHSRVPLDQLLTRVRDLPEAERRRLFAASVGHRRNRRHHPGREWEAAEYEFEVVSDYGSFRDLQRHRLLTIEWQRLGVDLGYDIPAEAVEAGCAGTWREAVERAEDAYRSIAAGSPEQASYLVTMGHRLRYVMRMNAREAMHLIELRSSPQGHPSYRRVVQEMHALIRDVAGHRLVADAMSFVNQDDVHLGRLEAERRSQAT
jgi:hypothetical protein